MSKILIIVLVCIILFLFYAWRRTSRKLIKIYARNLKGYPKSWPIKEIAVEDIAPVFKKRDIDAKIETEVFFLVGDFYTAVSGRERWILSLLAKQSKNIFELGTYTGVTTYILAKNSPDDAKVVTLTLHPDQVKEMVAGERDVIKDVRNALDESKNTKFLYENTPVAHKITQLYSDSKKFDETPYAEAFDLIFIDGAHIYSYVLNDTEKALKMLKPGGFLFWHDYRGPRKTKGVFDALNKIAKDLPLVHIEGTSFVLYRKPM